jgi:hypothetical protein
LEHICDGVEKHDGIKTYCLPKQITDEISPCVGNRSCGHNRECIKVLDKTKNKYSFKCRKKVINCILADRHLNHQIRNCEPRKKKGELINIFHGEKCRRNARPRYTDNGIKCLSSGELNSVCTGDLQCGDKLYCKQKKCTNYALNGTNCHTKSIEKTKFTNMTMKQIIQELDLNRNDRRQETTNRCEKLAKCKVSKIVLQEQSIIFIYSCYTRGFESAGSLEKKIIIFCNENNIIYKDMKKKTVTPTPTPNGKNTKFRLATKNIIASQKLIPTQKKVARTNTGGNSKKKVSRKRNLKKKVSKKCKSKKRQSKKKVSRKRKSKKRKSKKRKSKKRIAKKRKSRKKRK